METNEQLKKSVELVSQDSAQATIRLGMMAAGYQALADKVGSIEVTEDNIIEVETTIGALKKMKGVIDAKHKEAKEPYLLAGRAYDTAKNELTKLVDDLLSPLHTKYRTLCADIERRRREQEAEAQRKLTIQKGIESNLLTFSQKIAGADTLEKLEEVEKQINLQANRKDAYQEFYDEAMEKYATLTSKLERQRELLNELEQLRSKQGGAVHDGLIAEERTQQVNSQLQQNAFDVQNAAIEMTINAPTSVMELPTVFPAIKSKRVWKYEVLNMKAAKKAKLTKEVLDEELVKEVLNSIREGERNNPDFTEIVQGGIRYYVEKVF